MACGALLVVDRPGLRSAYFALGPHWQGAPYSRSVGAPGLDHVSELDPQATTPVAFSLRWRGWWEIETSGEHRFVLDADDGGYLRVDGGTVVELPASGEERTASGRVALERGFHRIEIGLAQRSGEAWLRLRWAAPGASEDAAVALPTADLYGNRPLILRRLMRRVGEEWPLPVRQLLGALLLFAGLSLAANLAAPVVDRLRDRLREQERRRGVRFALLLTLFVAVWLLCFPYTASVVGGDDTSYLSSATFNAKTWYVNRYGHVHLLKLFTVLTGGDPLLGVRAWWSFVMAATVAALAVAVRSVGSGLQLRTLVVTLFVLLAQPPIWGLIGAGFADYSAMMFVTVAVAIFLHGAARDRERPPPRREWHALWIGAATIGAFRSKEVGALVALLPLLFAVQRWPVFELRRFVRQLAYWGGGVVAALSILAVLDGVILGDFFFAFDEGRQASVRNLNFPDGVRLRKASWLNRIWHDLEMRHLWLGVLAGAVVAGARRREIHLRLLHLLPISYLLALLVLYVRLPHPFSDRMLIPILPTACLMVGLIIHYAGLDSVPWRRLARPGVLVPAGLVAAAIFLLVIPLQSGRLDVAALALPEEQLLRWGWRLDRFVSGVLLPSAVLVAGAAAALVVGRRAPRVVALLLVCCVVYGPGFEIVRQSLAEKRTKLRSDLLLYPWRAFREQLNASGARVVALSWDLRDRYKMAGATSSSLGRLGLGRPGVHVRVVHSLPLQAEAAITSREIYLGWLHDLPTLAESATFDPVGFLVLVRPAEAAAMRSARAGDRTPEPAERTNLAERLAELRGAPETAATSEMVSWMLVHGSSARHRASAGLIDLRGSQLRAVGLHLDGWTFGTSPAGLLVENRTAAPWIQRISLAAGDRTRPLPVRAFLDDGERVETILFADHPGPCEIELPPVAPFSIRPFVVWTDSAWTPGSKDRRELGIKILVDQR